ncbi:sensor histidine kinase [Shimia abyssi]|uniref:histidine kinase n=1 Tax=Shimia abyssi TaxID=1662395 RepID=A0A2P8FFN2_9RHOB|nr:ATP-binding protein [Shimia abyssi]PSL20521.1 histidine kinase/DNA gyrase B/HSP90-like ATPase [Shimia abyssi]
MSFPLEDCGKLAGLIDRIGSIADRPNSTDEDRLQHRFLIATGIVMSGGGILWGSVATFLGLHLQSSVPFAYVLITAVNLLVLQRSKNFSLARNVQILISILLPFVFQWSLGGLVASGGTMLWSMLCLSAMQSFNDRTQSIRWSFFFVFLTVASVFIELRNPPPLHLFEDEALLRLPLFLFTMNFLAVSAAIFALISIFMHLRRQMSIQLARRNIQLDRSRKALVQSEKMAAIGELVAGVAHELNTPLGAIRASNDNMCRSTKNILLGMPELTRIDDEEEIAGITSMLRTIETPLADLTTREERKIRKELSAQLEALGLANPRKLAGELTEIGVHSLKPEQLGIVQSDRWPLIFSQLRAFASLNRNCETIKLAADRSSKIVFALKNYAHPGNIGQWVSGSVEENMENVLTLYHNLIKRGVQVNRDFAEDNTLVADHDALNQVWTNLVHNALQAMDYQGSLTIRLKRDTDEIIVSVEDTGAGISPEVKDRVFEPLFTTKQVGEGTGLGLSISADIVRRHGGSITVESTPGNTKFSVHLPTEPTQPDTEVNANG